MLHTTTTVFSPPGNSVLDAVIPASAGAVPVVNLFHLVQFRREFPVLARRLDSMREKAATRATRTGGSEA